MDAHRFAHEVGQPPPEPAPLVVELTLREMQVLKVIMLDGCDYRTAAARLGVKRPTVATHVKSILAQTGMATTLELAVALFRETVTVSVRLRTRITYGEVCGQPRTRSRQPCQLPAGQCRWHGSAQRPAA